MPSPLGHALAGLAIAWSAEAIMRRPLRFDRATTLAGACAALAVSPDLDLLYPPIHRIMTHSLLASAVVGTLVWVVKRREGADAAATVALACGLAFASHLLLDWLGGDTKIPAGIQALWPFSDRWFISTFGVFGATDLGGFFTTRVIVSNTLAVLRELLVIVPVALAVFVWRGRRVTGGASLKAGAAP